MWSLRTILPMALVGLQALALAAIVALITMTSQDVLLATGDRLTERVARDATRFTENFLDPADDAAALSQRLAENAVVATTDPPRLTRYFYEILRAKPSFAGIFHGASDGSFLYVSRDTSVEGAAYRAKRIAVSPRRVELTWYDADFTPLRSREDPSDRYDPRARPWYAGAVEQRDVVWTDPYVFFTSQRPGITVAAPVLAGEDVAGAVGIDIEIDALSAFLDTLAIGENGSAAIVAQDGRVIAHRDAAVVRKTSGSSSFARYDEIGDAPLAAAVASLPGGAAMGVAGGVADVRPGEVRLTRFEVAGQPWRGAVQRLEGARTPWTVVTYLPEDDLLAPLKRVRDIAIAVALGVVLLTALLGLLLARSITRPFGALGRQAQLISEGVFDDMPMPTMRFRELDRTQSAMRRATSWLRKYVARNDALTAELAAAGEALERRVETRTAELANANAQLGRANENLARAKADAELLANELDHRVKNLFATAASLVTVSAREAETPEALADLARGRIAALAHAHTGAQNPRSAQLDRLVRDVLAPFLDIAETRVEMGGRPVELPKGQATAVGLILYELATNASKYGALSGQGGRLDVNWRLDAAPDGAPDEHAGAEWLTLEWEETAQTAGPVRLRTGKADDRTRHSGGFGTRLCAMMAGQLGGAFERRIEGGGLRARLTFPVIALIDADARAA